MEFGRHFLGFAEVHQSVEHQLREHGRGDLLAASVRVANQVVEPLFEVQGRDRGDFQERGGLQSLHGVIECDGFAACHFTGIYPGHFRVRDANVNITTEMSLLRAALCRESQGRFPDILFYFDFEEHDLLARACEMNLFAGRFDDLDLVVGFDVHGHVLDVVFHREQGDGDFDHVSRGEQAGHGHVEHQRFVYFGILRGGTVTSPVFGNHHGADFTDVFGHLEGVSFLFPALDRERTFEDHDRGKPVALVIFFRVQGFVTSYGKGFFQSATERPDNIIVEVPGFHA